MAVELAAVWINPYTLEKSRTGGVIARLLSLTSGKLVAVRMFAPSRELVEEYGELITPRGSRESRVVREQIRRYIRTRWVPRPGSRERPRVMMLLFQGNNIIGSLRRNVVGPIWKESVSGMTVRDTYGDYVKNERGEITYFEPAVLVIPERSEAEATLKLWARYSDRDGGLLYGSCHYPPGVKPENTLVMMKPENFRGQSSVAGNVMDIISRTGLRIIGANLVRMSIEQAEEFYGPVAEALPERMKGRVAEVLRYCLKTSFDFPIPDETYDRIADLLKDLRARQEFNAIIRTMTGLDAEAVTRAGDRRAPGKEKCLALIYQGDRAVSRIREVLGATDPTKAGWATVRRIYGHSINQNVAHASDSPANVKREMKIIRMEENRLKKIITEFYRQ